MTHTPADMREMADMLSDRARTSVEADHISARAALMLRQAADAMEKIERAKSLDKLAALSQELGLYDMPAKDTP